MIFGTTHCRAVDLRPPDLPCGEPYFLACVAGVLANFTSGTIEFFTTIVRKRLFTVRLLLFAKNVVASLLAGRAGQSPSTAPWKIKNIPDAHGNANFDRAGFRMSGGWK